MVDSPECAAAVGIYIVYTPEFVESHVGDVPLWTGSAASVRHV
jgi:hypothetical protein